MSNFTNKTALVTGSNRGIGYGFVKTLLDLGINKVYATYRDSDGRDELLALKNNRVFPLKLDTSNRQDLDNLKDKISELDILVNNAGIINPAFCSADNAMEFLEKEIDINLYGPIRVTGLLLPILKKSQQAYIINICSIAGISNFPATGTYSISKAALHSFTQGLRSDMKNTSVSVIGVYPGPTDTRMTEDVEMNKPDPITVSEITFNEISDGIVDVFPDEFSKHMNSLYLQGPEALSSIFCEMSHQ